MAADTSVVVAAFASWHEHHERAREVLDEGARMIDHCALEIYSVLTRDAGRYHTYFPTVSLIAP